MIHFNRETCCNVGISAGREWLVTNGLGSYASGTVAGLLTRRYHGLLIAALNPPVNRTLLVTKLDDTALYMGNTYPLFVNRWRNGYVDPDGYRWLGEFRMEGTVPVWIFPLGNARLEKRIWMQPGAHTTYVRYKLLDAPEPVTLELKARVNYRDHHANTHADNWWMDAQPVENGVVVRAFEGAVPYYLLCANADVELHHDWVRDFFLSVEEYRGYDPFDDNLDIAHFRAVLEPEAAVTFVATLDPEAELDGAVAHPQRRAYEEALIAQAGAPVDPAIRQLVLAADQFIVQRAHPDEPEGRTVMAGYHWFTDWGRDTMIALPGLTLTTGRPEVARQILRTFSHFVDQGMLPNRFPDAGEAPEYNTIDASLWYFEALRAYIAHTEDTALLRDLFPVLQAIIDWHQRGTRYNIHVDPADGLLYGGEHGVQLTWMDAKVGNWVVTPRIGKPVEVNALWYNALCVMADFAQRLDEPAAAYTEAAARARQGFDRFWNGSPGYKYCFDVLDGPDGHSSTLRPNQLLAVSLEHSPLSVERQKAVLSACERSLLTPKGVRSLAPDEPAYIGRYGGDLTTRDAAYHQGATWAWLIGPFVAAHWRVYHDLKRARAYLRPLLRHLEEHGVGSISEIFDGDASYAPRGCIAQAWSVGEFLRVWALLNREG